jgi:hypothetical protein
MKLVEKLTMDIFNQCIQYFEKEDNKTKLQDNVINPIIWYISEEVTKRIYHYVLFFNIIFLLTFTFVLIILALLIFKN